MAEPTKKLQNMKVLTVTEDGTVFSKKQNKDVKKYKMVLQGVDDKSVVIDGFGFEPLPEKAVVDGVLDDVWVYEDEYNGRKETKFFFPQKKGSGVGQKGSGYQYRALSPEEMRIKLLETLGKYVGVGYSYSFGPDSPPDKTVKEKCEDGETIVLSMFGTYEKLKQMLGI